MDLKKLKIDGFKKISYVDFSDRKMITYDETEVVIYFLKTIEDIDKCVKYCDRLKMTTNNRVVLVYEKGQKILNQDSIIEPFKTGTYLNYKMKAPILCSLDKRLSAMVFTKE
ncbi:MAG: hypothetical protein JEZ08_14815 [Clostridiales bacterium]|nr:hypothetical protein [Clostridiales bacterium]